MSNLILPWLFLLSVSAALLGISALGVGTWRMCRKTTGSKPGSVVASFGLFFLFISWTGYTQYQVSHKGRLDSCRSRLVKEIATALEMYATDHEGQLPAALSELTPTYLKHLPLCPAARRDTYSETYHRLLTSKGRGYRVSCGGLNHQGAGVSSPDLPTFHSNTGSYCDDYAPLKGIRFLQQSL